MMLPLPGRCCQSKRVNRPGRSAHEHGCIHMVDGHRGQRILEDHTEQLLSAGQIVQLHGPVQRDGGQMAAHAVPADVHIGDGQRMIGERVQRRRLRIAAAAAVLRAANHGQQIPHEHHAVLAGAHKVRTVCGEPHGGDGLEMARQHGQQPAGAHLPHVHALRNARHDVVAVGRCVDGRAAAGRHETDAGHLLLTVDRPDVQQRFGRVGGHNVPAVQVGNGVCGSGYRIAGAVRLQLGAGPRVPGATRPGGTGRLAGDGDFDVVGHGACEGVPVCGVYWRARIALLTQNFGFETTFILSGLFEPNVRSCE